MSNSNSFLTPSSSAIGKTSSVRQTPTAYDINAKEFGTTAATAIGVAATATDAVSATYNFSEEGLKRLSSMAGSAVDAVENAFSSVGNELSSIGHKVSDEVKKAYGAVSDTVNSVVSTVEEAGSAIEGAASSVGTAVSDAAGYVTDEVSSATDSAGRYLTLGMNALL